MMMTILARLFKKIAPPPLHIFVFVMLGVFCLFSTAALDFNSEEEGETLAEKLAEELSDEDALSQLFMFGWEDAAGGPSARIQDWINKRHIGGVKVFGWNTKDIQKLVASIALFQRAALDNPKGLPLLIATDQEGGLVQHIRDAASKTPGAMAIGASAFPEDAYRSGYYIGRELAVIGINMNFAPSVDLFTNQESVLIGPRSFGDDPVKTGLLAAAFAQGQLAAGIIPTAKHFPGHGGTALDSHGTLPLIDSSFEELWERELVPYRMLTKEKIPAVMSGHIAFPKTEAGRTPASISKYFIDGILRKKIGFSGLVITDDLNMNGVMNSVGSLAEAVISAIMAGNDIVMIHETPAFDGPFWPALTRALRNDDDFKKRVRESARRVLAVKLKFLRSKNAPPIIPNMTDVRRSVPDEAGAQFNQDLAARSVTLVRAKEGLIPLEPSKAGRVLLCYPPERKPQKALPDFFAVGRLAYPEARRIWYDNTTRELLFNMAADSDTIIFYLIDREEIAVLNGLRRFGKRVIVFSGENPSYLKSLGWVDCAIALYNNTYESHVAAFSALKGRLEAKGKIPFNFE